MKKRLIFVWTSFFIALGIAPSFSFAQSDPGLTTPVTIEHSKEPAANAPADQANSVNAPTQVDLGTASHQYVVNQHVKTEEHTSVFGVFTLAILLILAIGGIAYSVHPSRRPDQLL